MKQSLSSVGKDDYLFPAGLYRLIHAEKDVDTARKGEGHGGAEKTEKGDQSDAYEGGVGQYSEKLWEAGRKLVADGSPHCGTAAVREPFMYTPLTQTQGFPPAPGYGILNMETDALYDTIKRHHLEGTQVAIHCHGERSSEQVLKVYEQVGTAP